MIFNNHLAKNKYTTGIMLAMACSGSYALSPGATQQAITSIQEAEVTEAQKPVVTQPKRPLTSAEQKHLMAKLFKNKAFMTYLISQLKHPFYTETAKSVFTPAGTPMRWGGVGFSFDISNRYPSQLNSTYNPGFGLALPFGDSETSVGGVLSVGSSRMAPGLAGNMKFGRQGGIGLGFSRWLGQDTIATAGISNLMPWGVYNRFVSKTYYGAITQVFGPQFNQVTYPVSASFGLGTGGFGPLGDLGPGLQPTALNDRHVTPFFNAGINLTPDLAIVGDYYSDTFAAGVSYNKQIILPLSFMLYAGNLRTSRFAPSTTVGLRIATGIPWPKQPAKA